MNEDILNITAEVLEKVASYVDAIETDKLASMTAERSKLAEGLRTRFTEVTGEIVTDEIVNKLAASDTDIISMFEKLAGSAQAPDPIGGPGETADTSDEPTTKKEAADVANSRFLTWLQS